MIDTCTQITSMCTHYFEMINGYITGKFVFTLQMLRAYEVYCMNKHPHVLAPEALCDAMKEHRYLVTVLY